MNRDRKLENNVIKLVQISNQQMKEANIQNMSRLRCFKN